MTDRSTGVVLAILLAASTATAFAQTPEGSVDIGGHLTVLRLSEFRTTDTGVGVDAAWHAAPGISVDGAFTWFPGGGTSAGSRVAQQDRTLGLVGVRSGFWRGPVQVFARARAGFLRFSPVQGAVCVAVTTVPLPLECQVATGYTAFAADFGAGMAVAATSRLLVHVGAGDLLVRYGQEAFRRNGNLADGFTSHNLQISSGVSWRF